MLKETENLSQRKQHKEYGQESDINKKLIINMRDLNHIMRSLYEGKASQKRILIILNEVKSITQRDLTMRLGIQPGSASEILSKLENAGLILRTMSETDRRTANISLTDQGVQMALEAGEQRSRRHVEMFSCLSEEEKAELLALLEKVNEDWTCRYGAAEERRERHHGDGHRGEHRHEHNHDGGHGPGCDHECERGEQCRHGYQCRQRRNHSHEDMHENSHRHVHGADHDHRQGKANLETEGMKHVEVH